MPQSHRQQFILALFNTRNRVRFAMDDAFRPLGVTDATWRTLFYLEQGDGVTQKQLAEVMGIEGPSLVRLLDSLEAKALIERRRSEADRRSKTVHLTPRSRRVIEELHEVATGVRDELLRDIPDEELAGCMKVFEKILLTAEGVE